MNVGLQTFTVRHAQKRNITKAYLPIIEMGIKGFELARMNFSQKNARKIKALIDKHGIEIFSIQAKPHDVFKKQEKLVRFCKAVGCKRIIISMLPFGCILGGEKRFHKFVSTLDPLYESYARYGIALAYHHHNWEYVKQKDGRLRIDELINDTEKIKFVHDTYWTARCGISPAKQIGDFGNRLLGIHLRDLTHTRHGLKVIAKNAAVGEGVLNFRDILTAKDGAGCEYCVIEEKTKHPYTQIEKSYKYINSITENEVKND